MPGLASLSRSLFSRFGERRSPCAIRELDSADKPASNYMAFQYFPDTITDTKAVHYSARDIPGGSLPIYQWISSGERIISFTALFTADVDLLQDPNNFIKIRQNGQALRNVDVRTALLWLRRFMLPTYPTDGGLGVPLTLAPRKLILMIPNSGIGLQGGVYGQSSASHPQGLDASTGEDVLLSNASVSVLPDAVPAIMTQCDITYEAFFPSGLPRIASVQLQFSQIGQLQGAVNFPRTGPELNTLTYQGSTGRSIFPYGINVTFK